MYKSKNKINIVLAYLIIFCIAIFFIKEALEVKVQASSLFGEDGQTKVVMISIDYLDIQDIAENDYLNSLFNKSFSAFISGRQIGKATASNAKLSIGSTKRLMLASNMIEAENYLTQLENFHKININVEAGNVLYKDIKALKHANKSSEYIKYIGYLGDKLNTLGKAACVLGNSDTKIYNRNNVLIAMDSEGIVDYGDVENAILYDSDFPGGKRTDYVMLEELYKANYETSDFIVIDTGDLARLEYYKKDLTTEAFNHYIYHSIQRISQFLEKIIEGDKGNTIFILFSAYPSSNNISMGYKLTPIISFTRNGKGLLYSKSTRREGIITNLDIADYIIEKLSSQNISRLQEKNTEEPLKSMLLLKRRLMNTSVKRLPVLTWYAIFEIVCAVLGLLYMLNMRFIKSIILKEFVKTTLLANISAPAVLLYMAAFDISSTALYIIVLFTLSYFVAFIINLIFKDTISRFAAASFIVNGSLVIDLIRNSALIKNSVFGYDPIIGARFYGIGNEFAGVFIGSSILLAGCILQKLKDRIKIKSITAKLMLLLFIVIELYVIGMPSIGANFGAAIAAVCGYFFFYNSLQSKKVRGKHILLLGLAVAAVISVIILIDLYNSNEMSHIGKFIEDIRQDGLKVLLSTLERKLEMNLKLIKYTIWTKVLLCIILIISIMFFKPVRLLRNIFKNNQYISAAWLGISAASIAGLAVNDSGIVMAATGMIFTGYTILYMSLEGLEAGKLGG